MKLRIIFYSLTLYICVFETRCEDVVDAILKSPDLSIFSQMLEEVLWIKGYLRSETATIFAPTDDAFRNSKGPKWSSVAPSDQLKRHIVNKVINKADFDGKYSNLQLSPELWLNFINNSRQNKPDEYFVLNSKILNMDNATNYNVASDGGEQRLYKVDTVILQYSKVSSTAWDLITGPQSFGLTNTSLSGFMKRVTKYSAENLFSNKKVPSTFLIPVGSDSQMRYDKVDRMVIGGHVIPGAVIFTRLISNKEYNSDMYDKNIKMNLAFEEPAINSRAGPQQPQIVVKSHTEVSGVLSRTASIPKHGTVLSKIIPGGANIPVSNGVVHLIEAPLVVDTNILQSLENNQQVSRTFLNLIKKGIGFEEILKGNQVLTVFVPSNEAFSKLPSEQLRQITVDEMELEKLLYLHMLPVQITTHDLLDKHEVRRYTYNGQDRLYIKYDTKNKELRVEGGGVTGTGTDTDISATNGVIHIIDQVLGVPQNNIYDKISTDPQFRTTFKLGELYNWNEKLKNSSQVFTYFAPGEAAWRKFEVAHPILFSSLFTKEQAKDKVQQILRGYLVEGKEIMFRQALTGNSANVNARQPQTSLSYTNWNGKKIEIEKENVLTTNGVVHVVGDAMLLPFTSILGILSHTKELSITYELGERVRWNGQFGKFLRNFTYFVPTNKAWEDLNKDYGYDVGSHLKHSEIYRTLRRMVFENPYSLSDLLSRFRLKTSRDEIKLHKYPYERKIWIDWENIRVEIIESDIFCTNGIIHLISRVMISDSDITTPSATSITTAPSIIHVLTTLLVSFSFLFQGILL